MGTELAAVIPASVKVVHGWNDVRYLWGGKDCNSLVSPCLLTLSIAHNIWESNSLSAKRTKLQVTPASPLLQKIISACKEPKKYSICFHSEQATVILSSCQPEFCHKIKKTTSFTHVFLCSHFKSKIQLITWFFRTFLLSQLRCMMQSLLSCDSEKVIVTWTWLC